jgi:uncharacterized protein
VRIIASQISLRLAVALAAGLGLTLVEAARAVGASISGAKNGLEVLEEDGLASRSGARYELADSPAARSLVAFAIASLQPDEVLRLIAAGTGAVEFVGAREDDVLIVFSRGADPLEESRAAQRVEEVLRGSGRRATFQSHDDVRRSLKEEPSRRREYLAFRPLLGDPAVTFPKPVHRSSQPGRTLRRPRAELPQLSRRHAAALKARYGIASAKLFGSAVRGDFGPASDVDVAVRFSRQPKLRDLLGLERELEAVFDRDVEIVLEDNAKPSLRREIESEGVPLPL